MLPNPNLAVDGLTDAGDVSGGALEIDRKDPAPQEAVPVAQPIPEAVYDPEQLEIYGWESSWWGKIKGYISF